MAAACAHFLSKKWTWLLQKPASTVRPAQLSTSVLGGTVAPLAAATLPPSMKTMPSWIGSASGLSQMVPPTSARGLSATSASSQQGDP